MTPKLTRSTLRLLALLAALPAAVLVLGVLYMLGMTYLEGNPRGLLASVEWASETLTTTGYGADSRWQHPVMVVFVMLTQIAGLFLVFLIFPVYVLPFFEERFEARLARALPPMDEAFAAEQKLLGDSPILTLRSFRARRRSSLRIEST